MRAVADLDMAAAKTQAEKFNLRALSVPELIASGDIDIIVNLTVPTAHFEVTKQILKAENMRFRKNRFCSACKKVRRCANWPMKRACASVRRPTCFWVEPTNCHDL